MPALLEVRGTPHGIPHGRRPGARGRWRLLYGRAGRDRGHRGRERLGQIGRRAVHPEADPRSAGPHHRGRDPVRRPRPQEPERSRDARGPRARHRHGLPGADDLAQSRADDRPADHRDGGAAPGRRPRDRGQARDRAPGDGGHCRSGAAATAISASALRRHAPAGHDRRGARLQSQAADRRRAHHGARRHHPGADPGADEVAHQEARRRADHHHAQSRRGRPLCCARQRHVRRPDRRGRQRRRDLSPAAPSLHDGAAEVRAAARPAAPGAPRSGRGPAARSHQARWRLRLPAALPLCGRALRRGASAPAGRPTRRAISSPASATPRRSRHERDAPPGSARAGHALPDLGGRRRCRARSARSKPSMASTSRSRAARPWGWSAKAAAARPRPAAASCGWSARPKARSCSTARTSAGWTARG